MQPILNVKDVRKSFSGLMALNKVSFEINYGEVVGIIGPNGAGKTTLFNSITGFFHPDSGQVIFRGTEIRGLSPHKIVKLGMARTFQNGASFPALTVAEHLELARESVSHIKREDIFEREELIELLHLAPYMNVPLNELTHAIETRVQIAVLLALNPYLILLDEPAAGMNNSETQLLREILQEVNRKGLTVCLIEHNMRFVMDTCKKIIVLNLGSKLAEGVPEEIKGNREVVQAYLGSGVYA